MFDFQTKSKKKQPSSTRYQDSHYTANRKGKASYINNSPMSSLKNVEEVFENEDQRKINELIKTCLKEKQDSSISLQKLEELLNEASISQTKFDIVFSILTELDNVESAALEQLFYYKVNHIQEFEQESKDVTKEYKMEQLSAANSNTRSIIKQDLARRKNLMAKIKERSVK